MRGALLALLLLTGCTTGAQLAILDTIAKGERGVVRVENDLPYGAAPAQQIDFYAPKGAQEGLPVLVFIHGGSWASGNKDGYGFVGERFAARGYLTAVIGYRLTPGGAYPVFMEDTAAAIAKVVEIAPRHGGDPDTVYLLGHSAGAYNAVQVALADRFLRAQGLEPDIIGAVVGLSGPYDFLPLPEEGALREAFGTAADVAETQPIAHVRPDAPPMLLIHGSDDETVPAEDSRLLADALEGAGAEVRLVILEGKSHIDPILALALDGDRALAAEIDRFLREVPEGP